MKKTKRKTVALFRNDFTVLPSKALFVNLFITKQKFEVNAIRKNNLDGRFMYTLNVRAGWGGVAQLGLGWLGHKKRNF